MKVILTEDQFNRVILGEQTRRTIDTTIKHTNDFETTKHLIGKGNYVKSSLDQCGYYAIERFEENYGNAGGNSMGAQYFEQGVGEYGKFDGIIVNRIKNTLPGLWEELGPKEKMQLWSFMYNSDSGDKDQYRWLSVIYQTALGNVDYDNTLAEQIIKNNYTEGRRTVTDKNSPDYGKKKVDPTKVTYDKKVKDKALNYLKDTTITKSYPMNTLIKMIDGQYKALGQAAKYDKTWSYRPKFLNIMYDECMSDTNYGDKTTTLTQHVPHSISKTDLDLFVPEVRTETHNESIDLDSIKLTVSLNKQNLTYTTSDKGTPVIRLVLALSKSNEDCVSCENIKSKNESELISAGTFVGEWWICFFLIIIYSCFIKNMVQYFI